jgi:Membrane bound FAD containing D-sorbitol dehydrogenase.
MPKPTYDSPSLSMTTRRTVLAWSASVLALFAGGGASFAQTPAPTAELQSFLELSRILTGYDDLSEAIAQRILETLVADDPANAEKYRQLAGLSATAPDANALRDAARTAGLGDAVTDIVSAWYTGTVAGKQKTTVIAYNDALMYRPVEDGLIVPTYCDKGPMWWRDTLPPGVTRMPVNFPKVL